MQIAGEALCSTEHDVALPRLYLLGQQKSGTTTMATALFQAGAVPMVEYHPRGNVPGYLKTVRDNHSRTHLAGNVKESNLLASVSSPTCFMPTCLKFAQRRWERKFANFSGCVQRWRNTLLADLSTDNFPHGYRAPTLRSFYGMPAAKRLIFVVIMREPLQRFQSGFYWTYAPRHFGLPPHRKYAHNHTMRAELTMLRRELPPNYTDAATQWTRLVRFRPLDAWARSMYALNWKPWLREFQASQFVALPMRWALEDVGRATQLVVERFGVTLRRQPHILGSGARGVGIVGEGDRLNPQAHPTIAEDGEADPQNLEGVRWLATTFFVPDTRELARVFASAIPDGLTLGGLRGAASEDEVVRHLDATW